MASQDVKSSAKKKLSIYGKTARKRPRSTALLDDPLAGDTPNIRHAPATDEPSGPARPAHTLPYAPKPRPVSAGLASRPSQQLPKTNHSLLASPMPKVKTVYKDGRDDGREKKNPPPKNQKQEERAARLGSTTSTLPATTLPSSSMRKPFLQNGTITKHGASTKDVRVAPNKPVVHRQKGIVQIPRDVAADSMEADPLTSSPPIPIPPASTKPKPKPGRVRLIDQLAAQAVESSFSEPEDLEEDSEKHPFRSRDISPPESTPPADVTSTPRRGGEVTPRSTTQGRTSSKRRKLKATYGEQRTMRTVEEENGFDDMSRLNRLDAESSQDLPTPPMGMKDLDPFSFDNDEVEEESRPKSGILGLHALRQAGANHRFADELSDLADRIGTPQNPGAQAGRARKQALLELGRKLQDKNFVTRLSGFGGKGNLFRSIGSEDDVANGIVLVGTLIVLLVKSSITHLVDQLSQDGIGHLLSRLLAIKRDIGSLSDEGGQMHVVSKQAQSSLNTLRSALLRLDTWGAKVPTELSPRRVALKFLHLMCKTISSDTTGDIIDGLVPQLFRIVSKGQHTPSDLNFTMALGLLQEHSIVAMQSESSADWVAKFLPLVASILSKNLSLPFEQFGETGSLALKLALNTTNNNPQSAAVFSQSSLVRKLADGSLARFAAIQASMRRGDFPQEVYRNLVLLLGVLINVTEHCPSTPQSLGEGTAATGTDSSPLDGLIAVYLENRESCGTADSVEQTSLAVAYGYLAILLGYLSLNASVRNQLERKSPGKGIQYLLGSVREFMTLHDKIATDDLTTSLQGLVNELQVLSRRTAQASF